MKKSNLGLFEGHGIELEYMIVDRDTLDVSPIADLVLFHENEKKENEVYFPDISWSNELALHVIELKTTGPRQHIIGLHQEFQNHIQKINTILKAQNATLLPTSMHPWMDPLKETKLWPHGNKKIYKAYDRLFNCSGHGWSNLQSVHLNLSFSDDRELEILHESIRLILPILPSLVASSPFLEGKMGPAIDTRLWFYKDNQKRFASIIGDLIPESIKSFQDYKKKIYDPIERDIRPFDPDQVLEAEWVNSRAAIARFDRMAIEIRLLDIQECPLADIAVTYFITEILKIISQQYIDQKIPYNNLPSSELKKIFLQIIQEGDEAVIKNPLYLSTLGLAQHSQLAVKDIWWSYFQMIPQNSDNHLYRETLSFILEKGNLAKRMLSHISTQAPSRQEIKEIYQQLQICLDQGQLFMK